MVHADLHTLPSYFNMEHADLHALSNVVWCLQIQVNRVHLRRL